MPLSGWRRRRRANEGWVQPAAAQTPTGVETPAPVVDEPPAETVAPPRETLETEETTEQTVEQTETVEQPEAVEQPETAETGDQPRPPARKLRVVAWTVVAIVAIFAVLVFVELISINKSVTAAACISRAQANFAASSQPHQSPQAAGLGRLALHLALDKCGS